MGVDVHEDETIDVDSGGREDYILIVEDEDNVVVDGVRMDNASVDNVEEDEKIEPLSNVEEENEFVH